MEQDQLDNLLKVLLLHGFSGSITPNASVGANIMKNDSAEDAVVP